MRHRFKSVREFMGYYLKKPERWQRFCISPGGAAQYLGVSRQRVNVLINENKLDAVNAGDVVLVDWDAVRARRRAQGRGLTRSTNELSIVA